MKSKTPTIDHDLFTIRKLLLISGFICLTAAIIIISLQGNGFGSLLLLATIFSFFGAYFMNEKYKEYKKVYIEYLPEGKAIDILNHGSFEFNFEYLICSIKQDSYKINWTEFVNYKLINKKHIVLFNKVSEKNLVISETEMDKSDFIEVVEFIKERIN